MKEVVMKTKALVGVGPRGLRPGHIKGLFKGFFSDPEAKQARESFEELGLLYLDGGMPRWLRRALTSGLLTPLVKKLPEHGEAPTHGRPTPPTSTYLYGGKLFSAASTQQFANFSPHSSSASQ
jgi:hypothetical protein